MKLNNQMFRYILESLNSQFTVEQAQARHMVSDPRLGSAPVPFGFRSQRWRSLLSTMQTGDELWGHSFYGGPLCAERGIALIRNGEVVGHLVTSTS